MARIAGVDIPEPSKSGFVAIPIRYRAHASLKNCRESISRANDPDGESNRRRIEPDSDIIAREYKVEGDVRSWLA